MIICNNLLTGSSTPAEPVAPPRANRPSQSQGTQKETGVFFHYHMIVCKYKYKGLILLGIIIFGTDHWQGN